MTAETFALSELAEIGRLSLATVETPVATPLGERGVIVASDDTAVAVRLFGGGISVFQADRPDYFEWPAIDARTHLGAAALAYIVARLLGASEEEACGASLVVTAAANSSFAPAGLRVTLYLGAKLVRSWAWKRTQGLEYSALELHDLPDTPKGRALAILAVTRRVVQEVRDAGR